MINKKQQSTRMTGIDQISWNLFNDQDGYCIWGLSRLGEPLKDDLVEKTLKYLIDTIPILNCKPKTNWLYGRWQFIEKKDVRDLIVRIKAATDEDAKERLKQVFLNPINPAREAMIRIISIDGPLVHYFVIQIHHLVLDGEGLKRICVRFAEIYKELHKDITWKPDKTLDPNRSWWQIAKGFGLIHLWLVLKASMINIFKDFIKPVILKKAKYNLYGDNLSAADFMTLTSPYFESIIIDKEIMLKFKAFTNKKNCTVNDVLITTLSLATSKWNRDRGDNREWLKFAYTVNLRRWWGEPKGTFGIYSAILSFEEINRNLADTAIALSSVKAKVDKVKERIALDYFASMFYLKFVPYFLVRNFSLCLKEKFYAFVSYNHGMTNIGIVFQEAGDFGHTEALDYSFLAPQVPGGGSIYTITTYKNMTTIHLGCNEDYLKRESARSFLALWKEKIVEVIAVE
jgi:NRPS condensation-like uncharacterized protein